MAWQDFFKTSGGEKINDALNTAYSNAKATLTTREGFNKALDNIANQIGDPVNAAMNYGPMVMGQVSPLYHGSGANFNKFASNKIGTGEGAQAFGAGTYLTDKPDIARFYAEKIGAKNNPSKWEFVDPEGNNLGGFTRLSDTFKKVMNFVGGDPQAVLALQKHWADKIDEAIAKTGYAKDAELPQWLSQIWGPFNAVAEHLKEFQQKGIKPVYKPSEGWQYTLAVNKGKPPEADKFIDWEKQLPYEDTRKIYDALPRASESRGYLTAMDRYGSEVIKNLDKEIGLQTPWFLRRLGYTGTRYPSGTLSSAPEGGTNYVIYDPNDISILKKDQVLR